MQLLLYAPESCLMSKKTSTGRSRQNVVILPLPAHHFWCANMFVMGKFDATLCLQDSQPIINLLCVSSPPNLLECRRTLPMTSRQIALTSAERLGPRATERVSQSMLDDPLVLNRYQRIHVRLDICNMQMCAQHEKWGDRSLQLNEFVSTLS